MRSRRSDPDTRISASYTVKDWYDLRPHLDGDFKPELWCKAVEIFSDRVQNRFFEPVRLLQENPETATAGFGFAIMALNCLLMDALQAFREGRISGNELQSTTGSFIRFLRRPGFRSEFASRRAADDFVKHIRNGLLHDGETRGGWRIKQKSADGCIVNREDRVLYRDDFHTALKIEFDSYRRELLATSSVELRKKFLDRMDSICA